MKYNRRTKTIAISPSDHGIKLVAKNPKMHESIGFKIYYSNKGFGIEVFSQEEGKPKGTKMIMLSDDQKIFESSYIGIWKLKADIKRRVKKKFGGKR